MSNMLSKLIILALLLFCSAQVNSQASAGDANGAGEPEQQAQKIIVDENPPKPLNTEQGIDAGNLLLIGLNRFNVAEFMSMAINLDSLGKHHLLEKILEAVKTSNSEIVFNSYVSNVNWKLVREHLVGKGFSNCPKITNTSIGRGCAVLLEQAQMQVEDEKMAAEIDQIFNGFIRVGSNPDQAYDQAMNTYKNKQVAECKASIKSKQKSNVSMDELLPTNTPIFKVGINEGGNAATSAGHFRRIKSNSESVCIKEMIESGELNLTRMDFDPTSADNQFQSIPPFVSKEQFEKVVENSAIKQGSKQLLVSLAKYGGAGSVAGPGGIIVSELITPEQIGNSNREPTDRERYESNNRKIAKMESKLKEIDSAVELLTGTKNKVNDEKASIQKEQAELKKKID